MLRHPLAFAISSIGLVLSAAALVLFPQLSSSPTPCHIEETAFNGPALECDLTEAKPLISSAARRERQTLLADLGVSSWHGHGERGRRIKIAVLDSGFRDYRKFLGKGLPLRVSTRSFRNDRNLEARDSQHGILCGEVVHALAPDAELLFANWEPDSPQAFLDAILWAKSEGARVVSCSLIMPSWSDGEGGGEIHRALNEAIGSGAAARDLLFFAGAGNIAQRHWCGGFDPDASGWHRWTGDAYVNELKPWGTDRVAVELYGPVQAAYEISVWDSDSGRVIGRSMLQLDSTEACGRAVVRFLPTPRANYHVRLRCLNDRQRTPGEAFHVVVLGGALQHVVGRGSIPFPGDGASVLAVGAVDERCARLAYSSCGPNSRRPKPDFVASVPFPSLCRSTPFVGTSAAAPQAAGLAALVWSRHPDWTAARVLDAMRQHAVDLGPPGHDWETGHGLIRLPRW